MKDFQALIGKKVLITTANWFYGPDGCQYRGVHGTLLAVSEAKQVLGFVPSRQHSNWFIQVGKITITGCQVNYLIESDEVNKGFVNEHSTKDGNSVTYIRPTHILTTE